MDALGWSPLVFLNSAQHGWHVCTKDSWFMDFLVSFLCLFSVLRKYVSGRTASPENCDWHAVHILKEMARNELQFVSLRPRLSLTDRCSKCSSEKSQPEIKGSSHTRTAELWKVRWAPAPQLHCSPSSQRRPSGQWVQKATSQAGISAYVARGRSRWSCWLHNTQEGTSFTFS